MDNMRQIRKITRNNFNRIRNHCSLTTELNFDVLIILNTNAAIMGISKQIYALITPHIEKELISALNQVSVYFHIYNIKLSDA